MRDSPVAVDQTEFYVRTEISDADPVDFESVSSAIQSLGGTRTEHGFYFSSAQQRAAALELLGEKFGSRYFAIAD